MDDSKRRLLWHGTFLFFDRPTDWFGPGELQKSADGTRRAPRGGDERSLSYRARSHLVGSEAVSNAAGSGVLDSAVWHLRKLVHHHVGGHPWHCGPNANYFRCAQRGAVAGSAHYGWLCLGGTGDDNRVVFRAVGAAADRGELKLRRAPSVWMTAGRS